MTNRRLIPCVELKQVNLAEELASKCMERDIRPFAACLDVLDAYNVAVAKHPDSTWPEDVVHMTAIMAEEAGEAVQAANDVVHAGASIEPLCKELAQTAAMCIRCLVHLEGR